MRFRLTLTLGFLGLLSLAAAAQQQKLVAAQDAARSSGGASATADIAKAVGAPTAPLTNAAGGALTANDAAAKIAASGSGYKEVDADQAQKLANDGTLVIAAWSNPNGGGHLATVRPSGVQGDQAHESSRGPLLNNIGAPDTGIMGANWVFRKDAQVHYYTPGS